MATKCEVRRAVMAGFYQAKAEMAHQAIKNFLDSKGRSTWHLEMIAREDMEQEFRGILNRRLEEAGLTPWDE